VTRRTLTADQNPKHAAGLKKTPLHFIPPSALAAEGRVMAIGAAKYGPYNWSDGGVVASVYYDAAMRHLMQWFTGEDLDRESKESHLAHVRACMAIIIDAEGQGVLEDDRPKTTPFTEIKNG
jgi:hypothetical protein